MPLTASAVAARHYGSALDALLSGSGDPLSDSEAAIAAEPQFALAHAARARALQLRGRFAEARQAAAQAVELAAGASDWEQRSTAITAALMNGDSDAAFRLLQEQMVRHPRDALSLSSAAGVFGLIGFSGRAGREPEQVAFLEPLAPHYGDDWWFQAVLAFAWLENDRATRARALVERSLQTFGRNAHGAHIYAHALIESGAADAGHEFLRTWLPDYPDEGMMHCHLWWHVALFELHAGRASAALEVWRSRCAPGVSASPPINVFTDGASLLWRAELDAGDDPGARDGDAWEALRAYGEQWFARPGIFVDVHRALPLAALGRFEELKDYVGRLRERTNAGKLRSGPVVAELATAFGEYARGEYRACAARLAACEQSVVRIGGSRAQRRLVSETLAAARARA